VKKIIPIYTESSKAKIKDKLSILIGKKVCELRKSKNLSQENLGHLIDSNKQFIWKVENGKFNPTISTLYFLSKALKCNISELIPEIN